MEEIKNKLKTVYDLGFKHGIECSTIFTNLSNNQLKEDNKTTNNPNTTKEMVNKRHELFRDLTGNLAMFTPTTSLKLTPLNDIQKRFARYYCNRVCSGDLFIPVLKMRQEGMTEILYEIFKRETKLRMAGNFYSHPTRLESVEKTLHGYKLNILIVDDIYIAKQDDFLKIAHELLDYAKANNCIVIFTFTVSPTIAKGIESFIEFHESIIGKPVFRYNTININTIDKIAQLLSGKSNTFKEENVHLLQEYLGII